VVREISATLADAVSVFVVVAWSSTSLFGRPRYSIRGNPSKRTRAQVVAAAPIVTVIGVPPVVWAWGSGVSR